MGQQEDIQRQLDGMRSDLARARAELKIVGDYVKERIRVDNLTDGFQQGYANRMVQVKNTDALIAIGKLEAII